MTDNDILAKVTAALKAYNPAWEGGAAPAPSSGDGEGESAPAATESTEAPAATADDMQSRIAALKAKMEAGKAEAKAEPDKPASKPAPPKPGKDSIWPVLPVNKTTFGDERLYGPFTLNRWFSISAILLTISAVGMWVRDWDRDWKDWQRIGRERNIQALQVELLTVDEAMDGAALADVEGRIGEAETLLAEQEDEVEALRSEIYELEGDEQSAKNSYQIAKSNLDAYRYQFEEMRLAHGGDGAALASSKQTLNELTSQVESLESAYGIASKNVLEGKGRLQSLQATLTSASKERDDLLSEKTLAQSRLAKIEHGIFNDYVRNAPMVDMLRPTETIDQIVLDKLQDNYNFMHVGRIDRCTTCHINITDPVYTDHDVTGSDGARDVLAEEMGWTRGEKVLNAHPRLDLFLSDGSPQPMNDFGCTACHWGRGQAVEFDRTFHVPAADAWESKAEKEERWIADFGYDPTRHYWDWPMIPADRSYSSCYQCHSDQHRLDGAPEYNRPRALVEDLGCYGCHKMVGFEYLRKPGPDLTHIATKTTEAWAAKWLMSPKSFRPTTRMPHFWNQSNAGGRGDVDAFPGQSELSIDSDAQWDNQSDTKVADWRRRNEVEARSIISYVFDQSRKAVGESGFELLGHPKWIVPGDVSKGREVFQNRGCLGCHSIEKEGWVASDHGPDLSAIGSKVGTDWIYNWVSDPKHYDPRTAMPSLRLTFEEAWDVTAYLTTFTNPDWESRPDVTGDWEILKGIAMESLSSTYGEAGAKAQIESMERDGGHGAVERFVGQKMLSRYGCAGCHRVPGHYDDKSIGVDLTQEYLKQLSKFDFAFEASHELEHPSLHHTRLDWLRGKLEDPRRFDRLPVVVAGEGGHPSISHFDQKVKAPADKLKMPNFYLSEAEISDVVTFLLGFRADGIDSTMERHLDEPEWKVERASRLITERNCTGCHRMGHIPTPLVLDEDTIDEGFDDGLWLAEDLVVEGVAVLKEHDWLTDEIFNPWEDESYDMLDFLEEHPVSDPVLGYGRGEGRIGVYIDQKAYRPPLFRGQGAKVQPDWLHGFLANPSTVRTHLEVRMPSFGFSDEEAEDLAYWFGDRDNQPWPFYEDKRHDQFDAALFATGEGFFNEFQCNSCHPSGGVNPSNPDPGNWGPDLSLAATRLQTDWIGKWLYDPQLMSPGTKMPNFLGEWDIDDQEYTPYYDNWEERIVSIQHYLRHLDRAVTSPAGTN
ncbi:MAG: c-type cytochrome [Planctomycetota bacterium]|nr:c-type cytochrome [Planctomycetota bacterium]